MEREKLLKLLNRSSIVVGSKQVLRGISDGTVRCVIVAADADADVRVRIVEAAEKRNVAVEKAHSKRWLGEAAGVEVSAAAVGILKAEAID